MVAFIPFFSLVATFCVAALAEPLALVDSKGFPQCGVANFRWTGGVSPFAFTFGTTENSSVSNAAIAPNLIVHNYTIDSSDLPAGTPYTITVVDNTGSRQESPVLTVQPSSNSSCLSQATALPPPKSTSSTSSVAPTTSSDSTGPVGTPKASPGKPTKPPNTALIAGVAVAGFAIVAVVAAFVLVSQRRRGTRNGYTGGGRNGGPHLRALGSPKVDLDAAAADHEIEEMAIPDPYVFRPVSRGHTSMAIDPDALNRRPTAAAAAGASAPAQRSPMVAQETINAKGERVFQIRTQQSGGAGPSRMQDEDIDRLAARMVAMMSSGRLSDQSWSPAAQGSGGDPDEMIGSPPPMYHDVARRESRGGKR